MAETTREKLAREMTHWAPVESGPRVPEWLADLVRGASYLPYRLAGTPTDLGLLFTNAAGLTDPDTKYAGSSDWIIDLAAKHGLAAPRRGTTGELIGDIGGQIAMPGVSPAEMGAYAKALPFLLGTFGGMGAKTADTEKLAKAFELEQAGKPMRDVWQETGWFRAPWDQRWRFEIDDSAAGVWGMPADVANRKGAPLSGTAAKAIIKGNGGLALKAPDVVQHEPVYAAYPDIAKKWVAVEELPGRNGEMTPLAMMLSNSLEPGKTRSVALHEFQHGVQGIEGFARGGSPEMFASQYDLDQLRLRDVEQHLTQYQNVASDEARRARPELIREAKSWAKGHGDLFEDLPQDALVKEYLLNTDAGYARLYKEHATLKYGLGAKTPEQRYRRLAGEAEARLVQARRDLTPEMRGLLYPLEQMDTMLKQEGIAGGIDDLIVRYGDGPAMSIPDELPSWAPPERMAQWRKARENPALPVEQGGLGLGPANTAAERAKADLLASWLLPLVAGGGLLGGYLASPSNAD